MWQVSPQFKAELNKPVHTVAVRVDFLDTSFNPVSSVSAYSTDPNDVLIDGTVDVDVTRGTRRTITMSLLNPHGEFTPNNDLFNTNDFDGFFYVNRLIRLWRGVRYESGEEELAPVGTFMVDRAETLVERGMSTLVIAGSDLWKKFSKSQFGVPTTFAAGSSVNTAITTMAASAGVTRMNIDPLSERTAAGREIGKKVFEADETRGDALMKIAEDMGLEIYFDPMGVLTTREFRNPYERPTVWYYDETDDLSFFMRSSLNDDRLYNHVIVVGTAHINDDPPVTFKSELKDTAPSSPTNITKIGDRVFRFESALLGTQEATDRSCRTMYFKHFLLSQTVHMEAICNPALEGGDVIWVAEPTFLKIDQRWLVSKFSIPLVTSKQTLSMTRAIDIGPTS